MFLEIKPSPPRIDSFFIQSGKLGDSSAGFTQSLFNGQNFIDLTGIFLFNTDAVKTLQTGFEYKLIASGYSLEHVSGYWGNLFSSGATGDYRSGDFVFDSFYPIGYGPSGTYEYQRPSSEILYIQVTTLSGGTPYIFSGSGWLASGAISQTLTQTYLDEINLLNLLPRDFLKFCTDTLSGTGILTGSANAPYAYSSGLQMIISGANAYYPSCSTGAFDINFFNLRTGTTGVSGSNCCGTHYYDIYPSGGDTGNFVFIKLDGVPQIFTGYSGDLTSYNSGLLFPNYISNFITDLSGRMHFYYTGGHLDCPPLRISGLSTGVTGIFARISTLNGDAYSPESFACLSTGVSALSGYSISSDVICLSGCVKSSEFSSINCVIYDKTTLSFIIPKIKHGNYGLRIVNEFGQYIADEVLKVLAPPSVKIIGTQTCEYKARPDSFLLGEWALDFASTDAQGRKYFTSPEGKVYTNVFSIATGGYSTLVDLGPGSGQNFGRGTPHLAVVHEECHNNQPVLYRSVLYPPVLGIYFRKPTAEELETINLEQGCADSDITIPVLVTHPNVNYTTYPFGESYNHAFDLVSAMAIETKPHGAFYKSIEPTVFAHIHSVDVIDLNPVSSFDAPPNKLEVIYKCPEAIEETLIYDFSIGPIIFGWNTPALAAASAGTKYVKASFLTRSGSMPCNSNLDTDLALAFVFDEKYYTSTIFTGTKYLYHESVNGNNFFPVKDSSRVLGIGKSQPESYEGAKVNYVFFHSGC